MTPVRSATGFLTVIVRGLCVNLWMHELNEWLCLDGKPMYEPHLPDGSFR